MSSLGSTPHIWHAAKASSVSFISAVKITCDRFYAFRIEVVAWCNSEYLLIQHIEIAYSTFYLSNNCQ